MPSSQRSRKFANDRTVRKKALHTLVYISGLSGQHTLETGLAYYYRGHYIYAYPAGNLIEPIPYSTRNGILIQGIVSESAPGYDSDAKGLVEEEGIRALTASVESENKAREGSKDQLLATCESIKTPTTPPRPPNSSRTSSAEQLNSSSHLISPHTRIPHRTYALPPSLTSIAFLRDSAPKTFTPQPGVSLLAASAPASRLASRSASPSSLRPTSSHVGLTRLGGTLGSAQAPPESKRKARPHVEHVHSRPSSAVAVGYLYGLGDHTLDAQDLPGGVGAGGMTSERVKPCAIHGERCDGVSTERVWKTEEMMRGSGFVEEVPMVDAEGRLMVDWVGLLEEVRAGVGS